MEHIAVEALPRGGNATKGERKRLRRMGHIPAAVFGKGFDPILVTVEARDLAKVLQSDAGTNTLIDLSLQGDRHLVKLTEVDLHPIARTFLHVGLHKIARNELMSATIPIEIVGEPEDVRTNTAILEPAASSVDVKCLPENVVASLTLDVSDMAIGDVRYISDIKLPDNMELLSLPDTAVVSVRVSRAMVEEVQETVDAESAAAAEAAEEGEERPGNAEA